MTSATIRYAVPGDLDGITEVQLESWQRTYVDVLPESYRRGGMAEDLKGLWTKARLERDLVLVADLGGRVVGLSGVILESETTAYVDNLHVAKAAEGQGVGRALMARVASEVHALGRTSLHLTVVTENRRALGFYESLGGVRRAAIKDAMFGHRVQAYPIWWEALSLENLAKTDS